jgi:hypothetical protein
MDFDAEWREEMIKTLTIKRALLGLLLVGVMLLALSLIYTLLDLKDILPSRLL